jgi:hypothetical protein
MQAVHTVILEGAAAQLAPCRLCVRAGSLPGNVPQVLSGACASQCNMPVKIYSMSLQVLNTVAMQQASPQLLGGFKAVLSQTLQGAA